MGANPQPSSGLIIGVSSTSVNTNDADLNFRFGFSTAGETLDSLIFFGDSAQTITEAIDLNSLVAAQTLSASETVLAGYSEYVFDLSSLIGGFSFSPDTEYILEVRNNVSSGTGIYTTSDTVVTTRGNGVWYGYDGVMPEFKLGNATPVPEPGSFGLGATGVCLLLALRRMKRS